MILLGAVLFIVSAISVIYPLRFLMIPNRLVAICGVVLSFVIIGSAPQTGPSTKTANASQSSSSAAKPAYQSSGGCKTERNGDMTCSHDTSLDLGFTKSSSNSSMKCGTNPVTQAYECKTESSAN